MRPNIKRALALNSAQRKNLKIRSAIGPHRFFLNLRPCIIDSGIIPAAPW